MGMTRGVAVMLALLLALGCSRQPTNSEGNGPGAADGAGGREDPPSAPALGAEPAPSSGNGSDSAQTDGQARPQQ